MLDPKLREKLLALEKETPSLKEKYRKEIETVFEEKLTSKSKVKLLAEMLFGIFMFISGILAFVFSAHFFSFFLLFLFILISFFGLSGAIFNLWILTQGQIDKHQYRKIELTLIWTFGSIVTITFMLHAAMLPDPAEGALKLLVNLPVLIILVVATLHRFIEKAGLETKEYILRLEMRIAELAEKIEGKEKDSDE